MIGSSTLQDPDPRRKTPKRWHQPWMHHAAGQRTSSFIRVVQVVLLIQTCVLHKLTQVAVPAVLHSGEYYLFESDSEDEEETPFEEPTPQKQTACQVGTYIYTAAFEYVLLIGQ